MHVFKKGDRYFVLMIGVIILGLWLWSDLGINKHSLIAEVSRNGKSIEKIDLNSVKEPQYITLKGDITLILLVEKGRIRISEADCPNKICVETGWLTKPGDTAICAPSNTIVTIEVP